MCFFKKKVSPNKWMEETCMYDGTKLEEMHDGKMFCPRCKKEWSRELLHAGVILADAADKALDDLVVG
jgi:uncharacterized Zn finger protein (UPF0148 family)